jgi:hypothetical protein
MHSLTNILLFLTFLAYNFFIFVKFFFFGMDTADVVHSISCWVGICMVNIFGNIFIIFMLSGIMLAIVLAFTVPSAEIEVRSRKISFKRYYDD